MKVFSILILILGFYSCKNKINEQPKTKNEPMTYRNSDHENELELTVFDRNDEFIEIELTCIISSLNIKIENQRFKCNNIDPAGGYNMDMFDPSGDYNPGEVYDGNKPFEMVRIFLPYEEELEYVGFFIVTKDSTEKDLFETILR